MEEPILKTRNKRVPKYNSGNSLVPFSNSILSNKFLIRFCYFQGIQGIKYFRFLYQNF